MMPSLSSANAGAGASIELTVMNGQSPLPRVAYQNGVPPTRSTVGSGNDVEWPVIAPGVEPRHAEIAWDGQQVWVRDLGSQRGTYVGPQRIGGDWVAIQPGAQIRIGQAMIAAAVAAIVPSAPGRSDFDDDQPTQMVSDAVVPSAPMQRPALPKAPSTAFGAGQPGSESTVIVQSPFDESGGAKPSFSVTDPRGPAGNAAVPLPRIGKTLSPSAGLSAPPPPLEGPDSAEATVAFAIPDELPPAPTVNAATAAPPFGAPAFGAAPPGPPAGANLPFGAFGSSVFGSIPPPPPVDPNANRKPLFTLPKRTLIMLGAAFAAGLGLLVFGGHPPANGPIHPTAPTVETDSTPHMQYTPPIVGVAAGPTGAFLSATQGVQPPPPPDPHVRRPVEPPAPPIDTVPERIAANTLAQGRLRDAIPLYDQLAVAHPDQLVYAHVATILRRKIEAQSQQCPPGSPPSCVPTPPIAPAMAPAVPAAPPAAPPAVPTAAAPPPAPTPGAAPAAPMPAAPTVAPIVPPTAPVAAPAPAAH